MTYRQASVEKLGRAKEALKQRYGDRAWFRGVGIAPSKSGFVLRLNVDPSARVSKHKIPRSFHGYRIEVVFIRGYEPRKR